jgi:beta-lactamase class A
MVRYKSKGSKNYAKSQYFLAGLLIILLVIFALAYFVFDSTLDDTKDLDSDTTTKQQIDEEPEQSSVIDFDDVELQKIVDDWVSTLEGNSSVVISDKDGVVLVSENPNQVYFAASIYKIYVAYAGYQQIDNGEVDPGEIYLNGNTRAECLDLMIRDSDSPCAEKLWNELGKETLTSQLETYGIENTSMSAVSTSANDSAILLSRIARGEGLSEASRAKYLDSMKDQDKLYRRGLPSGFDSLIVYNKVGWNELKEWHDVAIIELPDKRQLIVSVMSENVGFRKIAELGKSLETYLLSL